MPTAGVAQRDRHVDVAVDAADRRGPPSTCTYTSSWKPTFSGGSSTRFGTSNGRIPEQRPFGRPGGSVGRSHRRERCRGKHERAARGGERRDRRPVGHGRRCYEAPGRPAQDRRHTASRASVAHCPLPRPPLRRSRAGNGGSTRGWLGRKRWWAIAAAAPCRRRGWSPRRLARSATQGATRATSAGRAPRVQRASGDRRRACSRAPAHRIATASDGRSSWPRSAA